MAKRSARYKVKPVPMPPPTQPDPRFYGTDGKPNLIDKATGIVKDKLSDK